MIAVIDYGMGNQGSILNRLKRMGAQAVITSNTEEIAGADKLILPGVGHFAKGMENLKSTGLIEVLEDKVLKEKTPVLGVCLGMQLFAVRSEEGDAAGLNWIDAEVKKFSFDADNNGLKIPHIGWKRIDKKKNTGILDNLDTDAEYYFVHSYHVCCNEPDDIAATTYYGYDFVSAIQKDNIYGTQFHPEKSHQNGINLLRNFVENV